MNEKEQWIKDTNEWALKVGDAIFNKEYYKQRQSLTDDTWKQIVSNLNITDPADKRFKMIPTKFQEQAMQGSVRKAINEDGVRLAGLAAAVPGTIIGGGALAKPVLSQMFYHPGTFFAETIGGTIGGLAGGAATDAITRGVSDYDSFANMIAYNSTIPEQYAEMLNPGMLLGGLAGGVGGNVLYNNVVKPTAQRAALPYLMAMQLNKNIDNTVLPLEKTIRLYRGTGTNGQISLDGGVEQAGQWFTPLKTKTGSYLSNQQAYAKRKGINNPTYLEYVDIPESQLEYYRAKRILDPKKVEFEPNEDYLIPLHIKRNKIEIPHFTNSQERLDLHAGRSLPETPFSSNNTQWDTSKHIYYDIEPNATPTAKTSLKFYERPSILTEAERLGIPKGDRNLKITNTDAFNFHLKNIENDLGYGEGFIRNPITWEQQINNLKSDKIGKFIGSGAESVVYEHPTNKKIVLKVLKSGVGENGISLNYLNNIINQRNQIPLQLPQYLYGRIKIGDYYYPVMQQKKIIPLETDLQTYIPTLQKLLKPHGFYLKDGKFTNDIYTIGDLSKGNIGVTPNGQLRFIDVQKWKQGGTINYLNLFK